MNSQQRRKLQRLQAAQELDLQAAVCHDSELSWLEAADGEAKPLRTFSGVAYSGDAMDVGWGPPVVVDMSGMDTSKAVVALLDHDSTQRVGHITAIDVGANRKLKISGQISASGPAAQTVRADATSGYPWQFSIGARVTRREAIAAGEKVNVNGRSFTGPLIVARASVLREVSFVAIGADASTTSTLAASASKGSRDMEYANWLAAKGFDEASLSDSQNSTLKAAFEAEHKRAPDVIKATEGGSDVLLQEVKALSASLQEMQKLQADQARVNAINSLNIPSELKASAVKGGLTADAVELQHLRASRPAAFAVHSASTDMTPMVLEAAACQHLKLKDAEKHFDDKTLQAAHTAYKSRISLQELLLQAAWNNGYVGRSFKSDHEGVLRAAFSGTNYAGILSNVSNKFLLQTYMAVESVWRQISAIRPVNDFKTVTSYRLTGSLDFDVVGASGEIKHGTLGQQSYSNAALTYGKMLGITRQDQINDDLSALSSVPSMLGRGAGTALNTVFWTEFLNNSSFFNASHAVAGDTGNSNYSSGGGSALGVAGLTAAELLFLNQVDAGGKPLGIAPKWLLVPPALKVTATSLFDSTEVRDTTSSTKYTTQNPFKGNYTPIWSQYLSNATISGYSASAWYLLADPADIPVIEVCFLNGQDMPFIETAQADFSNLGIQMRGVFDFGVAKQDYRGGVKSAGS